MLMQIWAAVVNVAVSVILSIPFSLMGLGNTTKSLEMEHVEKKFAVGHGGSLTLVKIREIMSEEGTREPVKVNNLDLSLSSIAYYLQCALCRELTPSHLLVAGSDLDRVHRDCRTSYDSLVAVVG
jgi:hypothetical protein